VIAHGCDPNQIDEETFTDICVMYADGLIGNRGIVEVLGNLTAGHFNSLLPKGKPSYKLQDIIPRVYGYIFPPLTEQDKKNQVNEQLLTFMLMNPKAPKGLFKGK
jgi:hypothetical protein